MQYEIKHIHESIGVTVVYVTHDQGEALTMSNRIAVFNDGKVQQLSSPDKLYEEPVNSFVAEFIGENNTFGGEISEISNGTCKVKLEKGEIINKDIKGSVEDKIKNETREYNRNAIFKFGDDLTDSLILYLERMRENFKKAS